MAKHYFGIIDTPPTPNQRFIEFEPEKYHCISIDDDYIEPLIHKFKAPCFWCSMQWQGQGLDYAGINIIPPESAQILADLIKNKKHFDALHFLLCKAINEGKFVIHYGL